MNRRKFASRSRPALAPLAAIVAALVPTAAQAADPAPTLSPVVVTGSRAEAESFEQPFSVDVVDMQAVQAGNLNVNASEALAAVPGLVVQNRQNYAQDLQISVRGFGARAAFGVRGVKLIADGIPASNPDGQGQAATFNLDTAERIEVLRGPIATVYGNHSGGVIQLFSRDGAGDPQVHGGAIAGAWGTRKYSLGAEGETGGVGYLVNGSRFTTDGYREHSAATRDQAFAKVNLKPNADGKLTLVVSGLRQRDTEDPLGLTWDTYKRDPRAVEDPALNFNTRKHIDHKQAGATWDQRFGSGRLQLVAYGGTRAVTQYQSIPTFVQANPRHSGGVVNFDREFHGLGARWIQVFGLGGGALTVTGGVDYDRSQDDRRGYENFVGATLGVKGALRRDETDTVTSVDPYVQASWETGDWTVQAGLRHSRVKFEVDDDYITGTNPDDSGSLRFSETTPAFGIAWRPMETLSLYASAARGFETPTMNELSYSGLTGTDGFNFDLKPSRSTQYEIGAKAFIGDGTTLNAALFHIRSTDELVVLASGGGRTVFQNAARTRRDGIELALDSEFTSQWRGKLVLTHLRAIYDSSFDSRGETIESGNRLPGIPATSAYAELAWTPRTGLTLAAEALYRSKVYVEDTNTERTAPAHTLVNLRLNAERRYGNWTLAGLLRLDNLFDREHIASVIVGDGNGRYYEPGPERSWYAGARLSYHF
ncbi:TonB-dependent receptor [Thauera sp. CAU 1555]|uniref:TonB-dependent receptor n=1 Tax=Thauera sedimentorum TaxID=2767595 RepID=A0ABR9B9K0_9RHOO|nr:TonB-dependent receptor [Thauera sedimentorum]MBC9071754.1 TonB-dependent receptor [Thauera sedimentorum]MBD8502673.1 TonB-dependent receptor [Thauera sedimentorum]